MLLVIMRQEVDRDGHPATSRVYAALPGPLPAPGGHGRAAGGHLLRGRAGSSGVQAVSAPALFFAAAVAASLAYLSIIYALSVTLQHIGKGICIVLVFAQIPGATGLYPIEMTSGFFQSRLSRACPFTYGIARHARGHLRLLRQPSTRDDLAILGVFFAVFMALGLLVRPLHGERQPDGGQAGARERHCSTASDVEVPARPYRFSQIVRALAGKRRVPRRASLRRYERFAALVPAPHPRHRRGAGACGARGAVRCCSRSRRPRRCGCSRSGCVWIMAVFVVTGGGGERCAPASMRQLRLDDMSRGRPAGAGRLARRDGARRRRSPGRRTGGRGRPCR